MIETYQSIISGLQKKIYSPVYFLMGEEDFYIDKISEYIATNVLDENEKDFNLTILYGSDVNDINDILNIAKRYPIMSKKQVVIVKEAQNININSYDKLISYLEKPQTSTLLVFCYKHNSIKRTSKLAKALEKTSILFESSKIKENKMPDFIINYLHSKNISIEPKAVNMLTDYIGVDLGRMSSELNKLIITVDPQTKSITPEQIEKNIGISKEYNNIELLNAIQNHNVLKANRIVLYFGDNQKTNPIQITISSLFNFFSNLMIAFYSKDKSDVGIASFLGLRSPWMARNYISAMKYYNGWKTMEIISYIRQADAMSKGVNNMSVSNSDILRELIFRIMH